MTGHIPRLWLFTMAMALMSIRAFAATITVDDDGAAAYQSIQSAINAAKPGDVIQVAEGVYEEHVEIRKNVHLTGAGLDETLITFSGENATILVTGVTDAAISGFTIAYKGPELNDSFRTAVWVRSGTCRISGNLITGTGQGIRCTDGANVHITRNQVAGNRLYGVASYDKVEITRLSENEVSSNGADGIYLRGSMVDNLTGNSITGNGMAGIAAFSSTRITLLSGNEISSNTTGGVYLSAATVKDFTGNTIQNSGGNGISTFPNTRIEQLSGNQIMGSEGYGTYLESTVLEALAGNLIQDNGSIGIAAFSDTQITQLSGNQILSNSGRGINLAASSVGTLSDNTIQENEHGIVATDGTQIQRLSGNSILSNEGRGVNLTSTMVEALADNVIRDNASDGIAVFSSTHIADIAGNQIDNNGQDGISLVASAIEGIRNNTIVGNKGTGIKTDGNYRVRVRNNIIAGNVWGSAFFQDATAGTLSPDLAYNNIWNNEEGNYGKGILPDVINIHVDPMFVDPRNRDYHLQALSPMIGAGEDGADIGAIPAVIRQMEVSGSPAAAGQVIAFRVTAKPNAAVSFGIEGIVSDIPMPEIESGVYSGEYVVTSADRGIDLPIILWVETESGYIQTDTSQTATLSGGIRSVRVSGSPATADGVIEVTLLADSGGYAEFSIHRIAHGVPMTETHDGTYTGSYRVKHGDNADSAVLTVTWVDRDGQAALDQSQTVRIDTVTVFAESPVKAGDVLTVVAAGKTGSSIKFSIPGIGAADMPMKEDAAGSGIYTGEYSAQAGDNMENGIVTVTVMTPSGYSFVNSTAVVTIDTTPPEIRDVESDRAQVQNGETLRISAATEPGSIVVMDVSALDTTRSLIALHEIDSAGRYSREITISPANEALNGQKTIHITAIDRAGNDAKSLLEIELANLEDPERVPVPETFIRIQPDVLPADGMSTALITASFKEEIRSASELKLEVRWEISTTGAGKPGCISDLRIVQQNHLTATYTAGLSVGEVALTLTFLESGNQMSTHLILTPTGYKGFSQISWDYLPRYTRSFQPVEVSGKLLPEAGGEKIILTIASPGGSASEIVLLETDPSGQFTYTFAPDREGTWSLQAGWAGNAYYAGAQSTTRQIAVVRNIPIKPLTEEGWDRLTTADGLTSNQITALAQDRGNRIWIGTDHGISVFDGQVSYTFTKADGLLGNSITALEMDASGRMWIGSHNGLSIYDGFRRFYQFTEDDTSLSYVLAVHKDRQNRMWIGGDGLVLYEGGSLQTISLPVDGEEYIVPAFAEDMEGNIWVGTNIGLFLYHAGNWSRYTEERNGLPGNRIEALLVDSDGVLWIAALPELDPAAQTSVGGGLARYAGRRFEVFNAENSELPSNYVTSLMEDSGGQILIGMLNAGVVRFNEWKPLSTDLEGLSVTSLLQDNQRQVWIGTDAGVYCYDGQTFNVWRITGGKAVFFQGKGGVIWAGSELGLGFYDGLNWSTVERFWNVPVYCIAQHSSGAIGVGSKEGLAVFDGESWQHLTEINGTILGPVTALISDEHGNTFLGTGAGTFMSLRGGEWQDLTDRLGDKRVTITDFAVDASGALWIGTADGLLLYDGVEARPVGADLNLEVADLAMDSNGNLWVATRRGLYRFDGTAWRTYTVQNSEIASDNVTSLAIDTRGRVWMGTDSGISRFDGLAFSYLSQKDAWVTYTSQNSDLVDDDIQGLFVDSFDELWISASSIVIRFAANLRPPDTTITRAPSSTVGTDSPFFEYTGADIESETSDMVFSYKVDSGEWSPYSRNTYIILRHQSNGVHTFFVRAMDKDSNVDLTPARRSFMVDTTPPVVTITQPAAREVVGGMVGIRGYAVDDPDFESYTLVIKDSTDRESFFYEGHEPVKNDTLALWDTRDVPDGIYIIALTAKDRIDGPDDETHVSTSLVPVTVDNLPPAADITSPINNQSLSGTISIRGRGADRNLESYRLTWTQDDAADEGADWQLIASEEVYTPDLAITQTWDSSAVYGITTVRLVVSDRAGNDSASDVIIQLENVSAKPLISITSPVAGAAVAGVRRITGTASDPTLAGYRLDFAASNQPDRWTEIITQTTPVTEEKLASWDTTTLPDGDYILRLSAMDSNGYTSSVSIPVVVDNSRPVAVIYPPADLVRGAWIAAGDVEINGTATDANFSSYLVEFGRGAAPDQWTSIEGPSEKQVQDGILRTWSTAGLNGEYTIRLTVTNKAGLSSVFTQPVTLDNQQPEAKILSPEENQFVTGKVSIIGTARDENLKRYQVTIGKGEDPASWDTLSAGSVSIEEDALSAWDTSGLEGVYSIELIAEDYTNEPVGVTRHVTVDAAPPQAEITSPRDDQIVSGDLEIRGTAQDEYFMNYLVEYAPGRNPAEDAWEQIEGLAVQAVKDGVLRRWNTTAVEDGRFSLRLTVTDRAGLTATAERVVVLDNQPPEVELRIPTSNGVVTGIVEIIGTASDANLKEYSVFVSEKSEANDWRLLGSGFESKTGSALAEWDTAKLEGEYSIKLVASDLSDQEPAEDIQTVIVDNTDPVALITFPRNNDQVGGVIQLVGTAADANFKEYMVEFGEGNSPQIWTKATAVEYRAPVEAGELMQWFPGERAGVFALRLTVKDQVDHTSTAAVTINILTPIAKAEGGSRTSVDGNATLYLPPRALSGDTIVSINPAHESGNPNAPALPGGKMLGQVYEICPETAKLSSSKPATLSIRYDGADFTLSSDKRLVIARFDGSRWIPIGGTLNHEERTITTAITEFGSYKLMEIEASPSEAATTISHLTCQPRLFSPNGSGYRTQTTISFHLSEPSAVSVMVYNRAGELVTTVMEGESMNAGVNAVQWDGKDENGELPSNMYIVAVKADDQIACRTVGIVNR